MQKTRVLVVEWRPLMRIGIEEVLEDCDDFPAVGHAATCGEAVRAINDLAPDVVVLGATADTVHQSEALPRLVAGCPRHHLRVLVLIDETSTAAPEQPMALVGALSTSARPEEFHAALRMLAAGYAFIPPRRTDTTTTAPAAERTENGTGAAKLDGITSRELDVLRLLARGLTNLEISRSLWLSESTVKSHVQNVLSKLGVRNRVSAVIYAYESGLVRARGGRPYLPRKAGRRAESSG